MTKISHRLTAGLFFLYILSSTNYCFGTSILYRSCKQLFRSPLFSRTYSTYHMPYRFRSRPLASLRRILKEEVCVQDEKEDVQGPNDVDGRDESNLETLKKLLTNNKDFPLSDPTTPAGGCHAFAFFNYHAYQDLMNRYARKRNNQKKPSNNFESLKAAYLLQGTFNPERFGHLTPADFKSNLLKLGLLDEKELEGMSKTKLRNKIALTQEFLRSYVSSSTLFPEDFVWDGQHPNFEDGIYYALEQGLSNYKEDMLVTFLEGSAGLEDVRGTLRPFKTYLLKYDTNIDNWLLDPKTRPIQGKSYINVYVSRQQEVEDYLKGKISNSKGEGFHQALNHMGIAHFDIRDWLLKSMEEVQKGRTALTFDELREAQYTIRPSHFNFVPSYDSEFFELRQKDALSRNNAMYKLTSIPAKITFYIGHHAVVGNGPTWTLVKMYKNQYYELFIVPKNGVREGDRKIDWEKSKLHLALNPAEDKSGVIFPSERIISPKDMEVEVAFFLDKVIKPLLGDHSLDPQARVLLYHMGIDKNNYDELREKLVKNLAHNELRDTGRRIILAHFGKVFSNKGFHHREIRAKLISYLNNNTYHPIKDNYQVIAYLARFQEQVDDHLTRVFDELSEQEQVSLQRTFNFAGGTDELGKDVVEKVIKLNEEFLEDVQFWSYLHKKILLETFDECFKEKIGKMDSFIEFDNKLRKFKSFLYYPIYLSSKNKDMKLKLSAKFHEQTQIYLNNLSKELTSEEKILILEFLNENLVSDKISPEANKLKAIILEKNRKFLKDISFWPAVDVK